MTATEATRDAAPDGLVIDLRDPRDGGVVGTLPFSSPAEVGAAITKARIAQASWAQTPAAERGAILRDAARALRDNTAELAALNESETGRPHEDAVTGVLTGAGMLDQYAELGPLHRGKSLQGSYRATDFTVTEPRGVVVALTPWNDPVAAACELIGAALPAGNVVVHKPGERAPHTGIRLGEILGDTVPDDVILTLTGDGKVGKMLTEDPRVAMIAHTGSAATGRGIAQTAARTGAKVLLNNGGNDPLPVDRDVHPVWAAEQAAAGAFSNAGQLHASVERIYVHQAVASRFVKALTGIAADSPTAALVDREHRERVHAHVTNARDKGAEVHTGGVIPDGPGAAYPPTVLSSCTHAMRVMVEETFGPVAPVRVVQSFDQGLLEAADSEYGLAATVLTGSMDHAQWAWRELPVGTVKINDVFGGAPGGAAHPRASSGQGFGSGPGLLDELTATKVVHIALPTV